MVRLAVVAVIKVIELEMFRNCAKRKSSVPFVKEKEQSLKFKKTVFSKIMLNPVENRKKEDKFVLMNWASDKNKDPSLDKLIIL